MRRIIDPIIHSASLEVVLQPLSNFVRTMGNVTDQMIKDYIEKHALKDDKFGDFKVES